MHNGRKVWVEAVLALEKGLIGFLKFAMGRSKKCQRKRFFFDLQIPLI